MSLDGTFTGLKASVAAFLARTDLTAVIPDFIIIAESQIAARMMARVQEGKPVPRRLVLRDDLDIADGDEYLDVPDDLQSPLQVILPTDPVTVLDYLSPPALLAQKQANRLVDMTPKFYTVVGSEYQLYPPSDDDYTAEQIYLGRLSPLATTPTNWLLTDFPNVYLYGSLLAAAPYLVDDSRMTVWGALFTSAIEDVCNADPMPTDKVTLRTDVPAPRRSGWNIQTDL